MKVRICPRCNSPNTEGIVNPVGGVRTYVCKNCGHRGFLFPEIEVKHLDELKKLNIKKRVNSKNKRCL